MTTYSTEHGQRRVRATPEFIESMILDGPNGAATTNLPDDAMVVDIWLPRSDDDRNMWTFIVESKEWDPLAEAERIPELELVYDYD